MPKPQFLIFKVVPCAKKRWNSILPVLQSNMTNLEITSSDLTVVSTYQMRKSEFIILKTKQLIFRLFEDNSDCFLCRITPISNSISYFIVFPLEGKFLFVFHL